MTKGRHHQVRLRGRRRVHPGTHLLELRLPTSEFACEATPMSFASAMVPRENGFHVLVPSHVDCHLQVPDGVDESAELRWQALPASRCIGRCDCGVVRLGERACRQCEDAVEVPFARAACACFFSSTAAGYAFITRSWVIGPLARVLRSEFKLCTAQIAAVAKIHARPGNANARPHRMALATNPGHNVARSTRRSCSSDIDGVLSSARYAAHHDQSRQSSCRFPTRT